MTDMPTTQRTESVADTTPDISPGITERRLAGAPGLPMLALCLLLVIAGIVLLIISGGSALKVWLGVAAIVIGAMLARGLTPVSPGQARVIQLLGRYVGTVRQTGLRWVNPFTTRKPVSTRIRNHQTEVTKVNDANGNPIEIAAVVVWRVDDTAQATFEVNDFREFVAIQAETAVRHIANTYPYEGHEGQMSLRDSTDEVTSKLSTEIGIRVEPAGVTVIESRLSHLAYAPEIAQAMLRRQQANAIVAARATIVEGAVGMVEQALNRLAEHNVVDLDEERKATMVSNLLVVLCGDRDAQPVVNAGSLYQ
jgi:regulator of protease activity HflC (stomatin/prohibitin superfamily)